MEVCTDIIRSMGAKCTVLQRDEENEDEKDIDDSDFDEDEEDAVCPHFSSMASLSGSALDRLRRFDSSENVYNSNQKSSGVSRLRTVSELRKEFEMKLRRKGVRLGLDEGYVEYMKWMGVNMNYHSLRSGLELYFDFKTCVWKVRKLDEFNDLRAVVHSFNDMSNTQEEGEKISSKNSQESSDGVFGRWEKELSKLSSQQGIQFEKSDSAFSSVSNVSNNEGVFLDVFDLDAITGPRGRHEHYESVIRFFEIFRDIKKSPLGKMDLKLGHVSVGIPSECVRAELTHSMVASSRLRSDLQKRAFFFQIQGEKQLLLAAESKRDRLDWILKLKPQSVNMSTRIQEIVQMLEANTDEKFKTYVQHRISFFALLIDISPHTHTHTGTSEAISRHFNSAAVTRKTNVFELYLNTIVRHRKVYSREILVLSIAYEVL